ncbi:uncharacterized protein BKA78DRAFT_115660 [Phyllosticta capitalensis]|uniref:uncharacterized protein n=1 Tax=Phyllosticta capitalensis TaxID=121624 RepID=UPI003131EE02
MSRLGLGRRHRRSVGEVWSRSQCRARCMRWARLSADSRTKQRRVHQQTHVVNSAPLTGFPKISSMVKAPVYTSKLLEKERRQFLMPKSDSWLQRRRYDSWTTGKLGQTFLFARILFGKVVLDLYGRSLAGIGTWEMERPCHLGRYCVPRPTTCLPAPILLRYW